MNDKSNTYMHYPTGSFSSLYLSLFHPSLLIDLNRSVWRDQHHSDYIHIIESNAKTQYVHFCQLRKQHDDPVLTLDGSPMPVVQEYKYLGLIFDKNLVLSHILNT